MENRHLIAKQVFELRVGFGEKNIPQIQNSFSRQYWESVVPAFERLFDRLVPPDKLVRLDRLEVDVGRWSAEDILSGRFVESLVSRLESVISSTLQETGVEVQPLRVGRFELWLYFLEFGFLPAGAAQPESREDWLRQVIECLASESSAVPRFRRLVSKRPVARERLILQHDTAFLGQLLELLGKRRQDEILKLVDNIVGTLVRAMSDLPDLVRIVGKGTSTDVENIVDALLGLLADWLELSADTQRASGLRRHMVYVLSGEAVNPAALAQWLLQADSWKGLLNDFVPAEIGDGLSHQIVAVLRERTRLHQFVASSSAPILPTREQVRRVELVVWRTLFDEAISQGHHADTSTLIERVIRADALLPWRETLLSALDANKGKDVEAEVWKHVVKAIAALPPVSREAAVRQGKSLRLDTERAIHFPDNAEKSRVSDAEKGDVFYVKAAGVILFHPFLSRFFQTLNLCEKGAFIDEASRHKAVCLIHHLATGEVRTPEYQLVLPKFLCGMPLNAPLDHFIEIGAEERAESENLIGAAIDHWGALGSCSPDWLREMFLWRDGKLEKRESGWHLSVERKAQDVLLSRLPPGWGLGMVKLPWMDEFLRIDW